MDGAQHATELSCLFAENELIYTDVLQLRLQLSSIPEDVEKHSPDTASSKFVSFGTFRTHHDAISGICVDDGVVVTGSWDASLRSFDIDGWTEGEHLQLPQECAIFDIDISNLNSELIGCACKDGQARLWNRRSGSVQELFGHESAVCSIDFHSSNDVLCTGGNDAQVLIWDALQGSQLCILPHHLSAISHVQFLGGSTYDHCLATACEDRLCRLWDMRQQVQIRALPVPATRCSTIASHMAHLVAAGTDCGDVVVWDLRTFTALECFEFQQSEETTGFDKGVSSIAFSPSCECMAVGSAGGGVVAVDFKRQVWEILPSHKRGVSSLAWGNEWPCGSYETAPYLLCASHDCSWSCYGVDANGKLRSMLGAAEQDVARPKSPMMKGGQSTGVRVEAIRRYVGQNNKCLNLERGDTILLMALKDGIYVQDGYCVGEKMRTGEVGWFPDDAVRQLSNVVA